MAFLLAGLAGVSGSFAAIRVPVVWGVGALSMGAMAFARPPNAHYFAPTFVLAALACALGSSNERRVARVDPRLADRALSRLAGVGQPRGAGPEQERLAASVEDSQGVRRREPAPGEVDDRPIVLAVRGLAILRTRADLRRAHAGLPVPLPSNHHRRAFLRAVRQIRPRFYVGPEATDLTRGTRVHSANSVPTRSSRHPCRVSLRSCKAQG